MKLSDYAKKQGIGYRTAWRTKYSTCAEYKRTSYLILGVKMNIGTPVYLKSGSPVMTVIDVMYSDDEPVEVEVVWFSEVGNEFKYHTLPISGLAVAECNATAH